MQSDSKYPLPGTKSDALVVWWMMLRIWRSCICQPVSCDGKTLPRIPLTLVFWVQCTASGDQTIWTHVCHCACLGPACRPNTASLSTVVLAALVCVDRLLCAQNMHLEDALRTCQAACTSLHHEHLRTCFPTRPLLGKGILLQCICTCSA